MEKARGYEYITSEGCDNRTADGRCAGHEHIEEDKKT